ncbi:hypothetical protein [Erwinia amylovora]
MKNRLLPRLIPNPGSTRLLGVAGITHASPLKACLLYTSRCV